MGRSSFCPRPEDFFVGHAYERGRSRIRHHLVLGRACTSKPSRPILPFAYEYTLPPYATTAVWPRKYRTLGGQMLLAFLMLNFVIM
mmetsp:Transcript_25994/g.71632  ORF Transcript_25994/g.71632 Transcript_25994/m.71632 type:complete len:86 (-) Transcript_25994:98-355(-)|eukprot:scaffold240983_cov30-Tisochrysis_lutea.AAC.2